MEYPCGKFGDCIVSAVLDRADTHTHTHTERERDSDEHFTPA